MKRKGLFVISRVTSERRSHKRKWRWSVVVTRSTLDLAGHPLLFGFVCSNSNRQQRVVNHQRTIRLVPHFHTVTPAQRRMSVLRLKNTALAFGDKPMCGLGYQLHPMLSKDIDTFLGTLRIKSLWCHSLVFYSSSSREMWAVTVALMTVLRPHHLADCLAGLLPHCGLHKCRIMTFKDHILETINWKNYCYFFLQSPCCLIHGNEPCIGPTLDK